jgi:hypothetical protein
MQDRIDYSPPRWVFHLFSALAVLGAVALVVGLLVDPRRTWANVLLLSNYLIGVSLGSLVLIALFYVSGARWSAPLQRLPEALAGALAVGAAGLAAALLFQPSLYPWAADSAAGEGSASPLRSLWLDRPFFLLRSLVYLTAWMTFTIAIIRNSRLQDDATDSVSPDATFVSRLGFWWYLASRAGCRVPTG